MFKGRFQKLEVRSEKSEVRGSSLFLTPASLLLTSAFLLLTFSSCANTTTTQISKSESGAIQISSGKNVTLKGLSAQLADGTKISIAEYKAEADPAVTKAQGVRERDNLREGGKIVGKMTEGAAKGMKGL